MRKLHLSDESPAPLGSLLVHPHIQQQGGLGKMLRVSSGFIPTNWKLAPRPAYTTHIHIPLCPLPKSLPKLLNDQWGHFVINGAILGAKNTSWEMGGLGRAEL